MYVRNRQKGGFTLVEIMVVVAIIALLATIAIPNYVKSREQARRQTCINNLKKLDEAKNMWAMEAQKGVTDVPDDSDIFGDTRYIKKLPDCPSAGSYSLNSVGAFPTCTVSGHSL